MKRGFLNKKTKKPTKVADQSMNATGTGIEKENEDLVPIVDELFQTNGIVAIGSGRIGIKLPIGKIPEHYVPKQRQIRIEDGLNTDFSDIDFLCSTIPPRPMNVTIAIDDPNTWAECLFKGRKQKQAILSVPNFPKLVPVPPETRYRIGPSPHGLGMFATKDLGPNDLILAERPILVVPAILDLQIDSHPDNMKLTPAQRVQAHIAEVEKLLQVCVDRMTAEQRKAFFELHNCHAEDGSGPIFGRVRTNGIEFSIKTDEASSEDKELFRNSGTFPLISRINHSCIPNVSHIFDHASFSLRLHAIRHIKAGEELCFSYTEDIKEPVAKRQEGLRPYGFQCACTACTDSNWDVRLSSILKSCDVPPIGPPTEVLNHSLRWIKIIEDAKLESLMEYFNHLTRVVMISTVMGRLNDVNQYNAKCEAWSCAMYGKSMTLFNS